MSTRAEEEKAKEKISRKESLEAFRQGPEVDIHVAKPQPHAPSSEKVDKLREIDVDEMIQKLSGNDSLKKFILADRELLKVQFDFLFVIASNYSFLIKIVVLHLLLSALPIWPLVSVTLMFLVEAAYLALNTVVYLKHRHFKSLIYFIQKIGHSLFCLIFMLVTMINFGKVFNREEFDPKVQFLLCQVIFIGVFAEYVFLFMVMGLSLRVFLMTRKKLKTDPDFKVQHERENNLIVYKPSSEKADNSDEEKISEYQSFEVEKNAPKFDPEEKMVFNSAISKAIRSNRILSKPEARIDEKKDQLWMSNQLESENEKN